MRPNHICITLCDFIHCYIALPGFECERPNTNFAIFRNTHGGLEPAANGMLRRRKLIFKMLVTCCLKGLALWAMKPERLVILFQKNILRWFYRLRPQTRTTRKRSLQLWPTEAICFLFYWKIKLSWEGHSWETRKRMNLSPTSSWCRQVSSDRKLLPHREHYFLMQELQMGPPWESCG